MFGLSIQEVVVVGIVAVLLYGKRLPDVARNLGKTYRDFRHGLHEIQSQWHAVDREYRSAVHSVRRSVDDELDGPSGHKFEPPKSHPQEASVGAPKFQLPTAPPRVVEPSEDHSSPEA